MLADVYMDRIEALCKSVHDAQMRDKDEVRQFIRDLTELIYDYKMMGKIYDFYDENIVVHKEDCLTLHGAVEVVKNAIDFCEEFPDCRADVENVIVYKVSDDFYKVFRRMRYRGTNTGYTKYGPGTGKSLGDGALNLTMMHLQRIDGQWKIVFEVNCDSAAWIKSVQTP